MPVELEAKMKVESLDVVREALRLHGATRVESRFEVNAFFDSIDRRLLSQDQGLRLRTTKNDQGKSKTVITFKGPQGAGALKSREEIEFPVGDFDLAQALLERLGYGPTLAFEKRRESWSLLECTIELDELPVLGSFVEIEGPGESRVYEVRTKLGLDHAALITTSYIALLDQAVQDGRVKGPTIRFP